MSVKPTFFIVFLIFVTLGGHMGHASQNPKGFLKAHNAARAEVGVGPMVWNATVAAYAKAYTKKLSANCEKFEHSGVEEYGENLAEASYEQTPEEAVKLWVDEKKYYDYANNKCVGGECLHYTQVVWRDSVQLGCGQSKCRNGWWVVSCNYYPPGNYVGDKPY